MGQFDDTLEPPLDEQVKKLRKQVSKYILRRHSQFPLPHPLGGNFNLNKIGHLFLGDYVDLVCNQDKHRILNVRPVIFIAYKL
jgi:hypothetical protein